MHMYVFVRCFLYLFCGVQYSSSLLSSVDVFVSSSFDGLDSSGALDLVGEIVVGEIPLFLSGRDLGCLLFVCLLCRLSFLFSE